MNQYGVVAMELMITMITVLLSCCQEHYTEWPVNMNDRKWSNIKLFIVFQTINVIFYLKLFKTDNV